MVQSLYSKRVEQIKIKAQDEDEKKKENQLGKNLDKIQKAR